MTYLLDSTACIAFLNQARTNVARRIAPLSASELVICAAMEADLYFGAFLRTKRDVNPEMISDFLDRIPSLPFDSTAARPYGGIGAGLHNGGRMIGANDPLIAATALAHDVTFVTRNVRDFSRVPGLRIEDWEAE